MRKAERIATEVRALEALNLQELREEWRKRYGDPPRMRSRELLARLLAWKIQADALGGLDSVTIRQLKSHQLPLPKPSLPLGTTIQRDWQGRRYEVEVVEGAFRFAGSEYRSLSEVARVITGTRWNGLRFFGLRENSP